MNPSPSTDRYTYRVHLEGPSEGIGWFLDELVSQPGFISAVQENPFDPAAKPMVVRIVLAQAASWKWSKMASDNCLIFVGLERV